LMLAASRCTSAVSLSSTVIVSSSSQASCKHQQQPEANMVVVCSALHLSCACHGCRDYCCGNQVYSWLHFLVAGLATAARAAACCPTS
jgi:hypothetical protein